MRAWDEFHVLVVEDGEVARSLIAEVLREAGCQVWTAADGVEAVKILEAEPVDLLLTDWNMPHMNGLELIRWSRAHLPQIPTVLMTGRGREEVPADAWTYGPWRILLKPFSIEHLLLIVSELRGPALAA